MPALTLPSDWEQSEINTPYHPPNTRGPGVKYKNKKNQPGAPTAPLGSGSGGGQAAGPRQEPHLWWHRAPWGQPLSPVRQGHGKNGVDVGLEGGRCVGQGGQWSLVQDGDDFDPCRDTEDLCF